MLGGRHRPTVGRPDCCPIRHRRVAGPPAAQRYLVTAPFFFVLVLGFLPPPLLPVPLSPIEQSFPLPVRSLGQLGCRARPRSGARSPQLCPFSPDAAGHGCVVGVGRSAL